MDTVVLIPAYNPNILMVKTVRELKNRDFKVLVVNDGSLKDFSELFDAIEEYADVLSYDKNRGKGYALKYGMEKLREMYPFARYFITADADGQHSAQDICNIREKLRNGNDFVLGVRNFKGNTPLRSRVGNSLSRLVFTIAGGYYLSDNQSGLRGFDVKHIQWLLRVRGDRYEYEMNMLMYAVKQHIEILTLPIETIYIDDNRSSHFNPLRDTLRIHKNIFRCALGSVIAFLLSLLLIVIMDVFFGWSLWLLRVHCVGVLTIVVSWLLNRFVFYRNFHFKAGKRLIFSAIIRWTLYQLIIFSLHTLMPFLYISLCFLIAAVVMVCAEYFVRKLSSSL